jgi:hypothetical protein
VPRRRRIPVEDELPDTPEYTAQPRDRPIDHGEDGGRLVPRTNVGGAAPTRTGHDSGGDLDDYQDDLSDLIEPEPPESPELDAVHVRARDDAAPRHRDDD